MQNDRWSHFGHKNKKGGRNTTLFLKVFNWIKETFNKLTGKTKGERFAKTFLLKTKNLYSTAIQDAGVARTSDNIKVGEVAHNLDKDSDVKYSYDDEVVYGKSGKSISDKNVQWTTSDIDSKGNERVRTKVGESQTNDTRRNRQEVGRGKESLQTISKGYGNVRVNEVNYESLSDIQKNIKDVYSKAGMNVVFYAGEVYNKNETTNI